MKNTNNTDKTHIVPNRRSFIEQFKDYDTRITDRHLSISLKQDLEIFETALWGCWKIEQDAGVSEHTLAEMVSEFQDLETKISKVLEFAELAQYATGFNIPEDESFRFININELGGKL